MNHPKSKNVYEIAMTLHYVALAVCNEVYMKNGKNYECGSPCCHGGWFEFAGYPNNWVVYPYKYGANLLARHLGFSSMCSLENWAKRNPEIWGGEHGDCMFSCIIAFEEKDNQLLTLLDIANHWYEVGSRLEEIENER